MSINNVGGLVSGVVQPGRSGGTAATAASPVVAGGSPRDGQATAVDQASAEVLKRISADLQRTLDSVAPELQFAVDQSTGRSLIKVTDRTTNKVIRQIPSEEALQIAKQIDEFQQHLLLKHKV